MLGRKIYAGKFFDISKWDFCNPIVTSHIKLSNREILRPENENVMETHTEEEREKKIKSGRQDHWRILHILEDEQKEEINFIEHTTLTDWIQKLRSWVVHWKNNKKENKVN